MSGSSDILHRIKEANGVSEEESTVRKVLPLGLLSWVDRTWAVQATGESGVQYALEVSESERRGRLTFLFRSNPDVTAKVIIQSPDARAAYIARVLGNGQTTFEGATRPAGGPESRLSEVQSSLVSPREAALGFQASLNDAHFIEAL